MPDREKVIGHLNDCMEASRRDNTWVFVRKDIVDDAIALIKEQDTLLKKAYQTLADMDFSFFCDDLMCDDGWCEEHCAMGGTTPECIERWMRKNVTEGNGDNA